MIVLTVALDSAGAGVATTAIGVVTVSEVVLVFTAGAAGVATNGGATATAGQSEKVGRAVTVSAALVTVAAGAAAATPDADGVEAEAAGALSFTAVVGEGVGGAGVSRITAVLRAAAVGVDAAQWFAIMVSSLAIKPFSAWPDVGATPKLCPASYVMAEMDFKVHATRRDFDDPPVWSSAMV